MIIDGVEVQTPINSDTKNKYMAMEMKAFKYCYLFNKQKDTD